MVNKEEKNQLIIIMKNILDTQNKSNLMPFKHLFKDTIPIVLYTNPDCSPYFCDFTFASEEIRSCFFRIEEITNSAVSLTPLLPLNEEGKYNNTESNPCGLKKTSVKVSLPLHQLSAIQCLDPKLVNRKIIRVDQK
ncbi:CotY/CotZ family spore coat protein [Jeotgalibacillus proteolyticus]|uniref:Spore coat protein n=1 Tax=Jeotgalibacillus proteolyticus TaxID=2082395 RepID=A0A2S5G7J0_9BACL|nr:CotY/CotZ family spore coat protein [Jeotgalibacillus proteolyticus]PPA68946.1 hypothetical protein C4B60_18725 [Jeotgalibacillus proteolyticus]